MITSHITEAGGIKLHYLKVGGGKKALLFLHGWEGSAESFRPLMEALSSKLSYTLFSLDLPSFGASGQAGADGFSSQDYARIVTQFLEKFPEYEWYIYGHSFGGRIASTVVFSQMFPIHKLVISGASGIIAPLRLRQKVAKLLAKSFSWVKIIFGEKIISFLGAKMSGSYDWRNATPEKKATLKKIFSEADFRRKLHDIKIPVLLLWGAKDTYTPLSSAHIFKQYIPHATLIVFPEGKHGVHKTHIQDIVPVVSAFLNSQ